MGVSHHEGHKGHKGNIFGSGLWMHDIVRTICCIDIHLRDYGIATKSREQFQLYQTNSLSIFVFFVPFVVKEHPLVDILEMQMKHYGEQEVRGFLRANGLEKRVHRFTDSTENAYLAAQALGVELGQIVKSVVFLVDKVPVLVLISGDMNVHTKKLKKVLSARNVRMADAEKVLQVTGYPVGAVPPIAHREAITTYLDKSLSRFSTIYPAAGTTSTMFSTTFDELLNLAQATIIAVAQPKKQ